MSGIRCATGMKANSDKAHLLSRAKETLSVLNYYERAAVNGRQGLLPYWAHHKRIYLEIIKELTVLIGDEKEVERIVKQKLN